LSASFTAILLAGDRPGDMLAQLAPRKRKALLVLHGRPMVLYVLETLLAARHVGNVIVVANNVAEIQNASELKAFLGAVGGRIAFCEGAVSPAASVLKCMEDMRIDGPVLVTTADNPLLTAQTFDDFCEKASGNEGAVVGLARERDILAVFPGVKRTFIRLGGEGYSGCNLFALAPAVAAKAARAWTQVEGRRKKPWQLIHHFGILTLLRAVCGLLDLDGAMIAASRFLGFTVKAIVLNDPSAAMDVDRPDHIAVAERVLAARP
jgi:molybdopterin-guanine dinucleotide biosynthesis protein A